MPQQEKTEKPFIKCISYADDLYHLTLRPLQESDAEAIQKAIEISRKNLVPFMYWAHTDLTLEKQLRRIKASQENYRSAQELDFNVYDNHSHEFMMSATIAKSNIPNSRALRIGYWTSSNFTNKGIATLVTRILIITAFESLNCDRLEITCNKLNDKSRRVIEK